MTEFSARPFASAAAIRHVGEGLLARTLPKAEWTHEAHLAACTWFLMERTDILPEEELPAIIRSYNEAVGGVNDDTQGYHETLTQLYIRGVRHFLAGARPADLLGAVNALLTSPLAERNWPLKHYSRETLFSVAARREWVAPDIAPI